VGILWRTKKVKESFSAGAIVEGDQDRKAILKADGGVGKDVLLSIEKRRRRD